MELIRTYAKTRVTGYVIDSEGFKWATNNIIFRIKICRSPVLKKGG